LITAGDAICTRFRDRKAALGPVPAERGPRADYYRKLSGMVTHAVATFRRTSAPRADVASIGQYISLLEGNAGLLQRLADAVDAGNAADQISTSRRIQEKSGQANQIAQEFGFKVCGSPS
jgi:hypothetical protein